MSYFEIIGKTERQSAGSAASGASNVIPPHDSGYSEQTTHSRSDSTANSRKPGHSRISSMGKGSGAMVYGIVQYDFNAERPDELEAKQGEAIIVIAQSNPEWFVAKPIGRLGGPGLIPVSFIEIRDMATGQAVPDAQGAVTRAGVPKVEEWKKMAADYKNSSITLGKFEATNPGSMQKDMQRMSLENGRQPQPYGGPNGSPYVGIRSGFHARQTLITANRTKASTNGNRLTISRTAMTGNHSALCLLQYLPRYPDTSSRMTSTGTSSSAKWKMADTGSSLASTRSFMISKSLSSSSFKKNQSPLPAAKDCYLLCPVL